MIWLIVILSVLIILILTFFLFMREFNPVESMKIDISSKNLELFIIREKIVNYFVIKTPTNNILIDT